MRIIFMGTPPFAVPALKALVVAGHQVLACYTQPPRASGRGKKLQSSAVHQAAESLGITVRHHASLKEPQEQEEFAAFGAEIAVVAAYGLILPQTVLDAPRHGCLNIHGSLLPRWRGAAPVQRAILAGDAETGITIMRMEAGLDTGPMLLTDRTPIGRKTASELTEDLAGMGARLMVQVLADLSGYSETPQPENGVTYASKIVKSESRLDFTGSSAEAERQVRAFAHAPGAFFELDGERYRVLAAETAEGNGKPGMTLDDQLTIACGLGAIRPTIVQRAGRPAMETEALLRGRSIGAGIDLG